MDEWRRMKLREKEAKENELEYYRELAQKEEEEEDYYWSLLMDAKKQQELERQKQKQQQQQQHQQAGPSRSDEVMLCPSSYLKK
jgi:hypothetical protein